MDAQLIDTAMISSDAHAAVAAGAALLDAYRPHWRDSVNLDELEMTNTYACVLGQVFAEDARAAWPAIPYTYGLGKLGVDYSDSAAYGFCLPDYEDEGDQLVTWEDLEALWAEVIFKD